MNARELDAYLRANQVCVDALANGASEEEAQAQGRDAYKRFLTENFLRSLGSVPVDDEGNSTAGTTQEDHRG